MAASTEVEILGTGVKVALCLLFAFLHAMASKETPA